jgi:hypothetical protein
MKRTVLAVMAASVLMFSLAGLYTAVVARAFIAAHVDQTLLRTPPNLVLVFLGYVVLACLMQCCTSASVGRPVHPPGVACASGS